MRKKCLGLIFLAVLCLTGCEKNISDETDVAANEENTASETDTKGESKLSGGEGTYHYYMIGTVLSIEDETKIKIRPHTIDEDEDFEYKDILHYINSDEVIIESSGNASFSQLQVGNVIHYACFASIIESNPIPVDFVEIIN